METEQSRLAHPRLWELDTIRGLAVVLMIIYHLIYDLAFFGVYSGNMLSTPWQIFARFIGTTFILVMGISLTLRYHRLQPELDQQQLFRQYLRRGATLFGWGMVITVVTYFTLGSRYVVFGILHLLGLSVILSFPFLRSRWASLAGGIVAIGLGLILGSLRVLSPSWLWLGLQQFNRTMVDYYPIFPWCGFVFLGVFLGLTLYPRGVRRFALPDPSHAAPIRALTYLGKHSLLIYLTHQPVLLGLLVLLGVGSL